MKNWKSLLGWLIAAVAVVAGATALLADPARATGDGPALPLNCPGSSDWYVNPDETDRKPERVQAGLKFGPADLVHQETSLAVSALTGGSYSLATGSDEPDQPSFFSVEVRDTTGAYGTLRRDGSQWSITIGAGTGPDGAATDGTFSGADPAALLAGKVTKWGKFTSSATVVSFGVGYTKNPPGTKTVTVRSVTFQGKTYPMTCTPPTTPTTPTTPATTRPTLPPTGTPATTRPTLPPTGTPSTTPPVTTPPPATTPPVTTPPATTPPVDPPVEGGQPPASGGGLPLTGPGVALIGGLALIVIGVGGMLVVAARRRKVNFES